jgi:hypothetical protein
VVFTHRNGVRSKPSPDSQRIPRTASPWKASGRAGRARARARIGCSTALKRGRRPASSAKADKR